MKHAFSPLKKLTFLLNYWWVISILAILGGLFGFFVSRLRQPIYDGIATLSAGIDYTATGQMSEAEQDRAYERIKAVLISPVVQEKIFQEAEEIGIKITENDFKNSFYLERKNTFFDLRVESTNPQNAAVLANIWSEAGLTILKDYIANSKIFYSFDALLSEIELCYTNLNDFDSQRSDCVFTKEIPVSSSFDNLDIYVPQKDIEDLELYKAFSISILKTAEITNSPRINIQNFMVAAGGLIGFCVGVLIIETGLLIKWIKPNGKIKRNL